MAWRTDRKQVGRTREGGIELSRMPRDEYPRPQFVRDNWINLNGEWELEFDDEDIGEGKSWYADVHPFTRRIKVPFCYQSALSGIGLQAFHDTVWYKRKMDLPDSFIDHRIILHFGAIDYEATVWVNGQRVADHKGGHVPFHVDVTNELKPLNNTIVVKARDFSRDITLPRGKQFWEEKPQSIWYTNTTGIWQTVWMEAVSKVHLAKVKLTPDVDKDMLHVRAFVNGHRLEEDVRLNVHIKFEGETVSDDTISINGAEVTRSFGLNNFNEHGLGRLWSPEKPQLYDIRFTLYQAGVECDSAASYFGLRKISVDDGKVYLNNRSYVMKLVLDQGYYPGGLLTAAEDQAFVRDIDLIKQMGFNGVRMHQKIEDPRFLYWCDKLGLLVWGEAANAYAYSEKYVYNFMREWHEAVERDYNHPSIVVWVPLNESWGVPDIKTDTAQQMHAMSMHSLTHSLDQTRLVVSNDGWEHMKSDLCTIHDYEWQEVILAERYGNLQQALQAMPGGRKLYVGGCDYEGQPLLITEFGGISFRNKQSHEQPIEGWGYSEAKDETDFQQRLTAVIRPLLQSPVLQGYCYTQLTDVEQETNGLLTFDRKPKLPVKVIRAINEGRSAEVESS